MINLFSVKTRIRLCRFVYIQIIIPVAVCLAWLFILSLAGCSTLQDKEREATQLVFDVTATPHANPDDQGRYSPIMISIYELKSSALFQEMDYFSLQANGKEVLGETLLNKEDYILKPGETRKIRYKTTPGTQVIGITASYRNITHAIWKKFYTLPAAPYSAWYRALIPVNRSARQIVIDTNELQILPLRDIYQPTLKKEDIYTKR